MADKVCPTVLLVDFFFIGTDSFWKVFHVSAVGTLGYKSLEGSMCCIGNSLDVMSLPSTKADIFGFGLVMLLLFLNQDGPKNMYRSRASWLVLSVNQTVGPKCTLTQQQKHVLKKIRIKLFIPVEITVPPKDNDRILPVSIITVHNCIPIQVKTTCTLLEST